MTSITLSQKLRLALSIILIILILPNLSNLKSQYQHSAITKPIENPYSYKCMRVNAGTEITSPGTIGFIKPSVTDVNTPPEAHFPVLIVYVQFAGETVQSTIWPAGSQPVYKGTLLALNKKFPVNGNWWDTYSESAELISDYWLEQSRGRFHVIGEEVNVILDHDYIYYQTNGSFNRVNDDVYAKLMSMNLNWTKFDKWKIVDSPGSMDLTYEPDGYVDMIYKIHRTHAPRLGMPAGGVAALGPSYSQGFDYFIDPVNNIKINGDYFYQGSGITISPGFGGDEFDNTYVQYAPMGRTGVASFSEHEHGHYLFGSGHTSYGKMSGDGGPYGYDECFSPWESIYLGYMIPSKVDFSISNYELGDFSSRNSTNTGEVLEITVNPFSTEEVFLIAYRIKVSLYDRIMWGDTARGDPYRIINPEYGKGLYVYHIPKGYNYYPTMTDQECADGLFGWIFDGFKHPDWSNEQNVEYYKRTSVSYDNDQSLGSMTCADGKSIFTWFSTGKPHDCIGCDGTDRVYSNSTDVWTSREFQGDRWDAWNVGYNEIFSPYSSPSTRAWSNSNSGIFIWYYDNDPVTFKAKLKIFKTGYNGLAEESILAQTPPSRPMGVSADFTECNGGIKYPKLNWLHNQEPDMINASLPPFDKKSYRIYIAKSSNINIVPVQYVYIETVNISKDSTPYFIDYEHPVQCNPGDSTVEFLRYLITAVDGTGWESVKSDFAALISSTAAANNNNFSKISPLLFSLMQNYPNPFNPSTKINFSIPSGIEGGSVYVKLIVYNILGEEITKLVDGYKQPGEYGIEFDGGNLPSGVYFYTLEASGNKDVKKMVLLK